MKPPDDWKDVVGAQYPRLFGLCLSLLNDRSDADDACQDAFIRAFESFSSFRGESSLATWLHRIAVNLCLDRLRRRRRLAEQSWEALLQQEGEHLAARVGAIEPGPQARQELADLAAKVLALLPESQRVALTLREVGGLSYEEIAQALGCSLDSVKARLRRARAELDQRLRHFFDPADV